MSGPGTSHLLPTYARVDLAFERGEGVWLVTSDGQRYLDFTSGVAVNALGHAHPHLVAAVSGQASKLWHVSNLYRIPEAERLAARLCEASFADTVFFCNSGAEAMECAIKMARKYQSASGRPERFRIVTFEGAFHGRTLATLAAGNAVLDVVLADDFLDRVRRTALLLKQRLAEIKDRYPAVIAEVRGEGLLVGLRAVVPSAELVDELRAEKMITAAAGDNVVRLLPPLIVSEEEMAEAVARIERACARIAQALESARKQEAAG